ncbi:Mu-like prophage major head subunit gpT family protein [Pseudomonas resinovorans]|uniref:Mu-like prophage major head subunit gpT family protein n=1 Tax=Metapseudomonas resinovorans TaxID=53412 RepID=A0ABT4Y487_METRE|nr:Mu-like prophage major head subunit gpT family protein [Pseudomonas resinovorans]MDA8483598.1 Mu-like prophage major head subunit gpT family protein [Pseudomonas resinovorans]
MLVNKQSIEAAFVSLKTIFNNAFKAAPSTWQKIAMKVPSNSGQTDYSWLSNFPKMKRWIGAKVVKALEAFKYTVVNEDWEATVEVDRNHIEDDQLGIYEPQAKMAGFSAAQLPDEIVYEAVNKAFTTRCYDGQYFFDTDHPVGQASVSNRSSAPLSNASRALADAGYGAARTAMRLFKDEEGRSLNIIPNVLLVGPALETTAKALLTNTKLADGSPNPYQGTAELVVDGRIESDTAWYLLDTSKPIMPFVYQERKAPVFVQQTNPESPDVFNLKKYKFGAEARAAGGYGFWQLAFGSTGQ